MNKLSTEDWRQADTSR